VRIVRGVTPIASAATLVVTHPESPLRSPPFPPEASVGSSTIEE
jgi:hypothetical protein